MNFEQLHAFKTLAGLLHFGKAAGVLHASPSALSRMMQGLERELGTRLLERDKRGVELTAAGKSFLAFAEESLHRKSALGLSLGALSGAFRGTLRVYASVTACYSILPPFAKALRREHPGLVLWVETGDPAEARFALSERRVDLALSALPYGGIPGTEAFLVRRTPLVFVAARDGAFGSLASARRANKGHPPLSELSRHPLILPARGLARERFDRWAVREKLIPNLAAETSGHEAVLALARLGLGLGLVPQLVLDNSPFAEGLVSYEAGPRLGDYEIGFLMLPQRTGEMGPALKKALKALLEKVYPSGAWVKSGALRRGKDGAPLVE